MGAQKVKKDFAEIEREAELADQVIISKLYLRLNVIILKPVKIY